LYLSIIEEVVVGLWWSTHWDITSWHGDFNQMFTLYKPGFLRWVT